MKIDTEIKTPLGAKILLAPTSVVENGTMLIVLMVAESDHRYAEVVLSPENVRELTQALTESWWIVWDQKSGPTKEDYLWAYNYNAFLDEEKNSNFRSWARKHPDDKFAKRLAETDRELLGDIPELEGR